MLGPFLQDRDPFHGVSRTILFARVYYFRVVHQGSHTVISKCLERIRLKSEK